MVTPEVDAVPTYQYACTSCEHRFEQVQSFSEDSLTVCPECEGRLRKLFNAVGIVFKGSGFYRTDSRSGNGSVSESGSSGSEGSSGPGNSSSSSDSSSGSSSEGPSGSSGGSSSSDSGSSGAGSTAAAAS